MEIEKTSTKYSKNIADMNINVGYNFLHGYKVSDIFMVYFEVPPVYGYSHQSKNTRIDT